MKKKGPHELSPNNISNLKFLLTCDIFKTAKYNSHQHLSFYSNLPPPPRPISLVIRAVLMI